MKRRATSPSILRWSLLVLSLMGVSLVSQSIFAGSVTNPNGPPVTKVSIYQGVLTIAPGRDTNNILEFGNNGSDIAATGNIYFRPGRLAATNSVRFDGTSGKTDVYVPGRLCVNGACVPPWPAVGGTSLWQQNAGQLETINNPAIQPRGVEILSPNTTDLQGGSALSAVGDAGAGVAAAYISNTNGPALSLNGGGIIRGDLLVNSISNPSPITIQYDPGDGPRTGKVWYPGNDGIGSTLDADLIDGQDVHFSFWTTGNSLGGEYITGTCGASANCGVCQFTSQCLCSTSLNTGDYTCIDL